MFRRIADDLRARIESGELAPGRQLPTQLELVEQYGVARMTVRQALNELVNEGLVISRRPQGFFVRDRKRMAYRPQSEFHRAPSAVMDRFMAAITEEGRAPSQTIEVALTTPPVEVQQRLNIDEKTTVVVRRRTRSIDGEPFNINDSYYPLDVAGDSEILSPFDIPRGANEVLTELGHDQVRAIDEIYIRMPRPDEVNRLDLAPGTPVALHICTGYTADDRSVRCVLNVLPGDRHVITYERLRPGGGDDSPSRSPLGDGAN
jgi:GntR family transcriptional regulator